MPKNKKTEWQVGDPAISVVSDQFCNPYPMDLLVKRKVQNFSKDHYEVFDPSGNLLLQIDGQAWGFNRKRIMRDPAGFTILTMRQKGLALKNKWEVHGGESKEREDLLFTVQQSQAVSLKTSVDIFLPENNNVKKTSNTCDFHASGGYSNISFKVFKSDALIAGVGFTWGSFCKGKYNFKSIGSLQKKYAIGSFELLSKTAPIQAISLLIFGPFVDYFLSGRFITTYKMTYGAILCILLSCALAVFCNISQYLCIGRFSATSFQVLGHMKTVCVLTLGWLIFDSEMTFKNIAGMVLAVVGMVIYSWAVELEKQRKTKVTPHGKHSMTEDEIKLIKEGKAFHFHHHHSPFIFFSHFYFVSGPSNFFNVAILLSINKNGV
ncbi:PREDICTED: uncharacterized protein LOC104781510 isoform X3 [Camelina sativa]|uniref:Uncharacterized protein LOC104781510 isoform X3 n=1 Tax=Camelina sativa TaxID=90675 RepID=A0ABM0YQQ0_CAMSA|nr:PREDICTED: uncharacterized protein LOC104781510 isoform X3 [Camelina sativa]